VGGLVDFLRCEEGAHPTTRYEAVVKTPCRIYICIVYVKGFELCIGIGNTFGHIAADERIFSDPVETICKCERICI